MTKIPLFRTRKCTLSGFSDLCWRNRGAIRKQKSQLSQTYCPTTLNCLKFSIHQISDKAYIDALIGKKDWFVESYRAIRTGDIGTKPV